MTNIIPVVNGVYATSYCWVDKCKKAVTDCGWGPLNYALLQHPEVIKTKPVTANDELTLESDAVETTASAVNTVTGMNLCTVTLNVTKGAVGTATDAIVLSEVKSIGAKKARYKRRAGEEDIATSGEQLTRVARVVSGALVRQGIYCLDKDLHQRVLTDAKTKQGRDTQAEENCNAREESCRVKALVVWERCRAMARSTMTQEELEVLIQDIKRVSDLPLRKVILRGDPLRPLMEAQCQEREVHLVKDKARKGNELMHYDMRVLLEVEGVATESDLLQQTEVCLCELHSTLLSNVPMG
jgi:hypothetical protein